MVEVGGIAVSVGSEGLGEISLFDVVLQILTLLGGFRAAEVAAVGRIDISLGLGDLFDVGWAESGEFEGAGLDQDGVLRARVGRAGELGGLG